MYLILPILPPRTRRSQYLAVSCSPGNGVGRWLSSCCALLYGLSCSRRSLVASSSLRVWMSAWRRGSGRCLSLSATPLELYGSRELDRQASLTTDTTVDDPTRSRISAGSGGLFMLPHYKLSLTLNNRFELYKTPVVQKHFPPPCSSCFGTRGDGSATDEC